MANLIDVQEFPAVPDACSPSDKQRLRIHVPNISTTLAMGAGAPEGRSGDAGMPNYPGFGVDTLGHVYVDARGGVAKSKMTLQANGQILIQSDGDGLYMVSSAPCIMATPEAANIAGGGGVNIVAGFGTSVTNARARGEGAPEVPHAIEHLPHHLHRFDQFWASLDGAVALMATAIGFQQSKFCAPNANWKHNLFGAANLAALGCAANNALSVAGKNPAAGGVTIHGTLGWILGTPLYGSAYAMAGLTIGSAFPAMIGFKEAAVIGWNVNLCAKKEVKMTAGHELIGIAGHKVEIASKHGGVGIKAKAIAIGSATAPGGQHVTEEVGVYAEKGVKITSKESAAMSAKHVGINAESLVLNGKKFTVGGGLKTAIGAKEIGIKAAKNVSVSTGKYFLNIDGSSLTLGNVQTEMEAEPELAPLDDADVVQAMASDTPMAALKELRAPGIKEWTDKWDAWADKVSALQAKNCSIEVKDGGITFEVQGYKFKIDSSATNIADGTLKIMK